MRGTLKVTRATMRKQGGTKELAAKKLKKTCFDDEGPVNKFLSLFDTDVSNFTAGMSTFYMGCQMCQNYDFMYRDI